MSDDEEMTDLSQLATQSGSIANSSIILSNTESQRDPWAQIVIYKIERRRLGIRGNPLTYSEKRLRIYGEKDIVHSFQ